MKHASKQAAILTGLLLVIIWVVVIAITVPQSIGPQPNGDHGSFTAVAEPLVAGDRQYVDIWDNNDSLVL